MYIPTLESIQQHRVPDWYNDCKLGIFVHWGLYSVPAWASPTGQLGEIELNESWYAYNPYAEWYLNSLRLGFGATYEHHKDTYGLDFRYEDFVDQWHAEKFDATSWAQLFKEVGAGYVVLTTKHHDGFCLWDSQYTDYNSVKQGPKKDLLMELSEAVKKEGLKMGVYYSGLIDWRYSHKPMCSQYEVDNPDNITYAYSDYAFNQAMELIDKVKPSVFWNDIGWPKKGWGDLPTLFSYYYNTVPEGVVNDRWSQVWLDYSTKEYKHGKKSLDSKWEMTRGLGLSFGYNQVEDDRHLISNEDLVVLLIDTVAHNGNLLINVGPKADGTIPENQVVRLKALGAWMNINQEAIIKTHPYSIQHKLSEEAEFFYTEKEACYYIHVTKMKSNRIILDDSLSLDQCRVLGDVGTLHQEGSTLVLKFENTPENMPIVIKVMKEEEHV